ncbi:MAG: hypothetical protein Q4F17_08825 [Eubacteriales bacterium]|nr:hypothetical protein [Eubacteriales bacterium]
MTNFDYYEMRLLMGLVPTLTLPAMLSIAGYVLSSLALYTLAKRRGIHSPWLAWIPVANVWILGSLSDQYRYVVLGQNRSKRKSLLTLKILSAILGVISGAMTAGMVWNLVWGVISGTPQAVLFDSVTGPILRILGLGLPAAAIAIAQAIIYYMALYDVYKSMDPNNCVVFLVLSILFGVTEPFFLFFNRTKDLGMPPRRDDPVYTAQRTWDAE